MKLGMQMYGPVAKGTLSMKELMVGLKNIGISMLEPCISIDGKSGAPTFWQPGQLDEYFSIARELGLDVISAHVSAADYIESIPAICEMIDKYHVKQMVVGVGGLSEAEIQDKAQVYIQLADALNKHGAELLLHNGKPDIAVKIGDITAYEYMIKCCEGKLAMQFDTGWAARGGADPMDIINRNRSVIKSFHFKDFDMRIDTDVDTCIGDGTLDNKSYMDFVKETGVPTFIDADTYDDVLADAKKSYDYLMGMV